MYNAPPLSASLIHGRSLQIDVSLFLTCEPESRYTVFVLLTVFGYFLLFESVYARSGVVPISLLAKPPKLTLYNPCHLLIQVRPVSWGPMLEQAWANRGPIRCWV